MLQHAFSWLRIVLNQATGGRLQGSSGDPAVDRSEDGEGCGLLVGSGGFEGNDAGEEDESAALSGFNGDDDVTASKEIGESNTFEAEGNGIDDLGRGSESRASGGSHPTDRGVELRGLAAVDLIETTQLGYAGDARAGLMDLDIVEDEEAAAFMSGSCGGVEFGRVLTIGVRVQVSNSARF